MSKELWNEMSDKKCIDCGRPLKKRIAKTKRTAIRCFQCFVKSEALGGHNMKRAFELHYAR